ncbi:hypothetical protein CLAIMM_14173 [Cladophialophora immunda]|nr:hypothetical protein CLAIMM_14173 [Cladophialophora immunda]
MASRIRLESLLNPDHACENSGDGAGPAYSKAGHTVAMLLNTEPSDQRSGARHTVAMLLDAALSDHPGEAMQPDAETSDQPSEAGRSQSPVVGGGGGGGSSSSPGPSPIMSISSIVTPKEPEEAEAEEEEEKKEEEEEKFDDEGVPAGKACRPYTEEHGYFVWYHRVDLREDWRHVGTKFRARFGAGRTVMSLQNLYYTFSRKKGVECRRIGAGLHVPGVVGRTDKRYSWMRPEHRRRPRRL